MKTYQRIDDNVIVVENKYFDLFATLFSGQLFRVVQTNENEYFFSTQNQACIGKIGAFETTLTTTDSDFFINFFDLDKDYSKMLGNVSNDFAKSAIGFSPSLKIMKQPHFETIIDFIMSANNNIKRFRKTLFQIAQKYGKKMTFCGNEYYDFPTPSALALAKVEDLKGLGCGYRDSYIVKTAKMIADGFDLDAPNTLDTISANKKLCELVGIGEKVADCILLFSYQKYDAFPVDTWIERLYHEDFKGLETNRKKIRSYFVDTFGEYAGIVQQYLFYYKRENK